MAQRCRKALAASRRLLMAAACALIPLLSAGRAASQTTPDYGVLAVRFAHVPYALARLVAGAETGPTVDIAFTIWPIRDRGSQRIILVDAGFYRDKFLQSWKPQDYVRPSEALSTGLGIAPEQVTDIILTH